VKFSGEIRFPELDHPGVPVQFVIDGRQAELIVEGESLGRWSLYDVHARRLVASAFQIVLDGTEVTFVADDPIDFAYRGVEHMAETWAAIKSRQIGRRMVAIRQSRKGTIPSRIPELRAAMEANLEVEPRPLAGEPVIAATTQPPPTPMPEEPGDWDRRDVAAAIPLVNGEVEEESEPMAEASPPSTEIEARLAEDMRRLEEERQRIAEERARLEAERLEAEQREAVRIEAYRIEMQRLEAEREELRSQAALAAEIADEVAATQADEPVEATAEEKASAGDVFEAPETPEAIDEPEGELAEDTGELEEEVDEVEETRGQGRHVLDLSDLEEDEGPEPDAAPTLTPRPQPVLAAAAPSRERGLRGAVRAAFTRGGKEHDHAFIEAPGGIGITRYVCEICGYVSISSED
jgi:hypothetical protein